MKKSILKLMLLLYHLMGSKKHLKIKFCYLNLILEIDTSLYPSFLDSLIFHKVWTNFISTYKSNFYFN